LNELILIVEENPKNLKLVRDTLQASVRELLEKVAADPRRVSAVMRSRNLNALPGEPK